jgi:peptidoglycan/LPS O-acetylase OafA/YrhL
MGIVRFLLALSVAVSHAPVPTLFGLHLLHPVTAVQAFYVISGYLITTILNERPEYANVKNFLLARYLRLWPSYFVMAVATPLAFGLIYFTQPFSAHNLAAQVLVTFSDLTLIGQDWLFYLSDGPSGLAVNANAVSDSNALSRLLVVSPSWTLSIELTFYLIAPFVCRSPIRLSALFAFGVAVRLMLNHWALPGDPFMYRFAPAEMMLFAAGGLAYFANPLRSQKIALIALALLVPLILARDLLYRSEILYGAFGVLSFTPYLHDPLFLLLVVLTIPALARFSRESKADAFVGELSYPVYICHLFVIFSAPRLLPTVWLGTGLAYVLMVTAFAIAMFVCIDRPVGWLRHHLARRGLSRARHRRPVVEPIR